MSVDKTAGLIQTHSFVMIFHAHIRNYKKYARKTCMDCPRTVDVFTDVSEFM